MTAAAAACEQLEKDESEHLPTLIDCQSLPVLPSLLIHILLLIFTLHSCCPLSSPDAACAARRLNFQFDLLTRLEEGREDGEREQQQQMVNEEEKKEAVSHIHIHIHTRRGKRKKARKSSGEFQESTGKDSKVNKVNGKRRGHKKEKKEKHEHPGCYTGKSM